MLTSRSYPEHRRTEKGLRQQSPLYLLLMVAVSILVTELLVMFVLTLLPHSSLLAEALIDGFLLTMLVFPVLFLFVFRPLTSHIAERERAEEAARNAQEELAEQERQEKERVAAELEKVQKELVRKSRLAAVGQVSASIAHDLRNPLGSVRNAAYYLKRILPKADPRIAEFLGIIDEEVRAADRIIGSLLAMTQAREPAKQTVNLARLVTDVFNRSDKPGGVRCRITTDPDPFELSADPGQLRQLIGNLLQNAIDAMGGQGQLMVEAARNAAYDTILIRDTGPGFAREVRRNLFEPLISTKVKGTGLGLAICRQIAESHGGTINIADHEGPGAVLEIRLPR